MICVTCDEEFQCTGVCVKPYKPADNICQCQECIIIQDGYYMPFKCFEQLPNKQKLVERSIERRSKFNASN